MHLQATEAVLFGHTFDYCHLPTLTSLLSLSNLTSSFPCPVLPVTGTLPTQISISLLPFWPLRILDLEGKMRDFPGTPGTVLGLALRISQFVFAAGSIASMATTSSFFNFTAFCTDGILETHYLRVSQPFVVDSVSYLWKFVIVVGKWDLGNLIFMKLSNHNFDLTEGVLGNRGFEWDVIQDQLVHGADQSLQVSCISPMEIILSRMIIGMELGLKVRIRLGSVLAKEGWMSVVKPFLSVLFSH
ncbi:hypothetical protein V8G54_031302 [Vigna mungo]|uniref:Uncharacterized protein n=1 Tax=Vigna mungo TaxID=3915 RepID=A0AAQ3MY37_VIGMU